MKKLLFVLASAALMAIGCQESTENYDGLVHLTFEETFNNFPNPERGFYVPKNRPANKQFYFHCKKF